MTERPPPRGEIHLHIEELILYGFPTSDRHAIGAAMERELARLLQEGTEAEYSVRSSNIGNINLPFGASSDVVGERVAVEVHRNLNVIRDQTVKKPDQLSATTRLTGFAGTGDLS